MLEGVHGESEEERPEWEEAEGQGEEEEGEGGGGGEEAVELGSGYDLWRSGSRKSWNTFGLQHKVGPGFLAIQAAH